jgi:putative membrane protein
VEVLAMFRHWGYGGPWIFFGLFRLLFWVVVIGGLFYVFRRRPYWHEHHEARSGESVLAERYAKGEISEEEYRQRLTVLRESRR